MAQHRGTAVGDQSLPSPGSRAPSPVDKGAPAAVSTRSRRSFLRVAGLAAGALLLAPAVRASRPLRGPGDLRRGGRDRSTVQAAALGKLYQGTSDGLVLESVDDGLTWQQVANFGSHCRVVALTEREERLLAKIGVGPYAFELISTDARRWYTV